LRFGRKILRLSKKILAFWRLIPLLATTGGLTWSAREFLFHGPLLQDVEAWGVYFSVFGILYAVIIGFILIQALERFKLLNQTIDLEINAIQDIRDFTLYLDGDQEETCRDIRRALLGYVRSVVEQEWTKMADPSLRGDDDTSPELYELMHATNKIRMTNESDSVALSAIIDHVAKLTTFRTQRFCTAREYTPQQIIGLLIFMSCILVGGLILTAVQTILLHYIMTLCMATAVYLSFKTLSDLDHPLSGVWKVDSRRFKVVISALSD